MDKHQQQQELAAHVRETAQAIAELHAAQRAQSTAPELFLERTMAFVSRPRFLVMLSVAVIFWVGLSMLPKSIGM